MPEPKNDSLRELLDRLTPPDNVVVITDIRGNEHRLDLRMSALQQIRVARVLERLVRKNAVGVMLANGATPAAGSLVEHVSVLLRDDEAVSLVSECFRTAYPTVCTDSDPLDVFSIEEVITALLPLAVRPLARLSGLLSEPAPAKP